MTSTPTPSDTSAVTNVLLSERTSRDLANWGEMREAFLDDSQVRVSWFRGSGAEFVDASRAQYEAGSRSFHEIGAPHVEVRGDRALAHAGASVHVRAHLDGVEADLTSYGRLYWHVRRIRGSWGIASLEMLYIKDTLAPADPTRPIPAGSTDPAATYRPSYRYLALLLHAAGHRIDQELPGTDRPELVESFLADHRTWLQADG